MCIYDTLSKKVLRILLEHRDLNSLNGWPLVPKTDRISKKIIQIDWHRTKNDFVTEYKLYVQAPQFQAWQTQLKKSSVVR